MRLFAVIALLFVYANTIFVNASESYTEQAVSLRIDALTEDSETLPNDMITELDQLIAISDEKNWVENQLKAQTLKAELFIFLEKIQPAADIVRKYHPTAKKNNFQKIDVRLQMVKLSISNTKGYSDDVEKQISALLDSAKNWEGQREAGSIYIAVGQSQYVHGQLRKSLSNLQKAYNIFNDLNDETNLSYVLNSLANLYTELNDVDSAITYLKQAVNISRKHNDILSVSIILHNLGNSYIKKKQFDLAYEVLSESLQISIDIDDQIGIIWAKQSIAEVYLKQNNSKSALVLFKETSRVFEETGDERKLFQALLGLFDASYQLNAYDDAQHALDKIFAMLDKLNSDVYRAEYSQRVAFLANAQGHYQKAYKELLSYTQQIDALNEKEKKQNVQNLKVRFETELKENRNKRLEKENELQQLKIDKQNNEKILWVVILFFAFIMIIGIAILLRRRTKSRNAFKHMAMRDHLTKSPNRRSILQNSENLLIKAKQEKLSMAVCIADLDYFKKINDEFGHDVGDEVLKSFANACESVLRKQDYFGRYGGEEWLFSLIDVNSTDIKLIFERIHNHLNTLTINGFPKDKSINFSLGISYFNAKNDASLQSLITKADQNLYKAKAGGRNQAVSDHEIFSFHTSLL